VDAEGREICIIGKAGDKEGQGVDVIEAPDCSECAGWSWRGEEAPEGNCMIGWKGGNVG